MTWTPFKKNLSKTALIIVPQDSWYLALVQPQHRILTEIGTLLVYFC